MAGKVKLRSFARASANGYDYWQSHFHDDRGVVGRVVQLNHHPFTIIGVAPPEFRGTIVFFSPNFWVPIVNHKQIDGGTDMNKRGSRWIFMSIRHLKPGVTLSAAMISLAGGAIGMWASVGFLRWLSQWQPFGNSRASP